jgi:hypothetical protein
MSSPLNQHNNNMKNKTNEQKLRGLIKSLDTIEVALLTERIERIMELTLQDIAEDPEKYNNFFVHSSLYVSLSNKVIAQLK